MIIIFIFIDLMMIDQRMGNGIGMKGRSSKDEESQAFDRYIEQSMEWQGMGYSRRLIGQTATNHSFSGKGLN